MLLIIANLVGQNIEFSLFVIIPWVVNFMDLLKFLH